MRDFHNIDLLERIENNPKDYIVHRKVNLLDSFIMGYELILLEIKDIEMLEYKYKNIPSLNEYAREKYNANDIGSRNIKSILEYNSENELEYYCKYLNLIKEYESKYLLEDKIEFIIKPKYEFEKILVNIKKRFPMYFGNYNLENLRAFIDGYIICKKDYNIEMDVFDNSITKYLKNIKCSIIEMEDEIITWDRKYTYNKSFSSLNCNKEIINDFFIDLENSIGEMKEKRNCT